MSSIKIMVLPFGDGHWIEDADAFYVLFFFSLFFKFLLLLLLLILCAFVEENCRSRWWEVWGCCVCCSMWKFEACTSYMPRLGGMLVTVISANFRMFNWNFCDLSNSPFGTHTNRTSLWVVWGVDGTFFLSSLSLCLSLFIYVVFSCGYWFTNVVFCPCLGNSHKCKLSDQILVLKEPNIMEKSFPKTFCDNFRWYWFFL